MKLDLDKKENELSHDRSIATLTVTEKTTVVSHDTQDALPELKSDMTYSEAFEYINALYKLRLRWERDQYHTSCTRLYELLRECYRVALHSDINDVESKLRRCIEDQCKRKMLKILKNTTIEAKIVRSVFESLNNRRRVSAYAIVIQVAKLEKVKVDHFVDWLTLKGGVEEVRLSKSKSNRTNRQSVSIPKSKKLTAFEQDQVIKQNEKNLESLLDRLNNDEVAHEENDLDALSASQRDTAMVNDTSVETQTALHQHLDICTDENCYCNDVVSNDDTFICESVEDVVEQKSMSQISQTNTTKQDDDELIVCVARRRGSEDVAEIVFTVDDDRLSRLVFARYTLARYGESEQLTKLTQSIISELAA